MTGVRFMGDDALTSPAADPMTASALAEAVRAAGDWLDVVPGLASVTARFDPLMVSPTEAQRLFEAALAASVDPHTFAKSAGEIEIPVVYGGEYGPDLGDVAAATGLSGEDVVRTFEAGVYRVDLIGFMPGFAYLGGLDSALHIPRRRSPRTLAPAGAVAVAAGKAGIYPLASPGGWSLIGRTEMTLFDPAAAQPFLLKAGMTVRFRAAGAS